MKFKNRKIFPLGESLTITLPKLWTQELGLKKGDVITFETKDNFNTVILKKI